MLVAFDFNWFVYIELLGSTCTGQRRPGRRNRSGASQQRFLMYFFLQTAQEQSITFTVYAYDDVNGPGAKVGPMWVMIQSSFFFAGSRIGVLADANRGPKYVFSTRWHEVSLTDALLLHCKSYT